MASITITLKGAGLDAFAADMKRLANKAKPEMQRGLSDGGNKLRTDVSQALRDQTGVIRYGAITSGVRGYVNKGALSYVIAASGSGLPIRSFRTTATGGRRFGDFRDQLRDRQGQFGELKARGGGVTSAVWNAPRTFQRSFRRKDGEFVATLPGERRQRKLYGPSLPKELPVDQSVATWEAGVGEILDSVMARLEKLMG